MSDLNIPVWNTRIEDKTIDAQGALLEDLSIEQQSFVFDFIDRWEQSKDF